MCEPTLIAISLGAAKAVTGIQQQNAQWAAQRDAVARSNHMATTKYANELTIAAHNDKLKGLVFEKELQADAAAQTELAAIRQNNQIAADQATTAAQIAANENPRGIEADIIQGILGPHLVFVLSLKLTLSLFG